MKPRNKKPRPNSVIKVTKEGGLLDLLRKELTHLSRTNVKSLLYYGQVSVSHCVVTKHNHQLKAGDEVIINWNKDRSVSPVIEGLAILFEDKDLIVINKDKGILSTSRGKAHEATAYKTLQVHVKSEHQENKVFVIHRLDRDTSGVMIFAKSMFAKHAFQTNWTTHMKKRSYVAVVEGIVKEDTGKIHSWLSENSQYVMYQSSEAEGGKEAITHYKVLQRRKGRTLLELSLETGVKNQIRVHLKELGHPVVGDKKYGSKSNPIQRIALHAQSMSFIHPETEKLMSFTTDLPVGFKKLMR